MDTFVKARFIYSGKSYFLKIKLPTQEILTFKTGMFGAPPGTYKRLFAVLSFDGKRTNIDEVVYKLA